MARRPSTDRAALLAAALLAAACPSSKKSEPAPEPPPVAARPPPGVKVPLPDGWVATAAGEGTLLLGPPGRTVLRIDLRAGAASQLPSPHELEEAFRQGMPGSPISGIDHESREDLSLVVLSVGSDGGHAGGSVVALLGAKRVGADLYLCSTVPGAPTDDVKLAAGACREIHVPAR